MSTTFRPTTPSDRPRLAQLLAAVFGSPTESSLLDPRLISWKYWDPRPDWTEPRSYVLERDGEFVGHVALWPAEFAGARGIHMIDWAASRESPGAGVSMVQRLARMFDFILAIGGSDTTRKVLPAMGFTEIAHTWEAARPLRPLRQMVTHQSRNWKLAARLARNGWWAHSPSLSAPAEWGAEEVSPAPVAGGHSLPHTREFFEYLGRCPAARFRLFAATRRGEPVGHFLLSLVRGQARLAGVWLRDLAEADFHAVYTLAQRVARGIDGAYELAAKGTEGVAERAAAGAGLHIVAKAPVFLLNKKGLFTPPPDFQFQLIDDDGAFLDIGRANYLT